MSRAKRQFDELLKRAPRGLRAFALLHGAALGVVLTAAVAAGSVMPSQGFEIAAFAKPAQPHTLSWDDRVQHFGDRVVQAFGVKRATALEFAGWILEASDRQRLDPELIASVIITESSFRKYARSHAGAVGPAQVRPHFWSGFCGASDLTDPEQNVYCGAQVLAYFKDRCGNDSCALAAYNIGLHSERRQAGLRYVSKVDNHRAKFALL